jgi:hypothetical protein
MQLVEATKALVSASVLTAAAAIAFGSQLYIGFVVYPTLVSPEIGVAYSSLDESVVGASIGLFAIAALASLGSIVLATWMAGRGAGQGRARPYSLWRTLKWAWIPLLGTWLFAQVGTWPISIRVGRLVPLYDDPDYSVSHWTIPAFVLPIVAVAGAVIMSILDARASATKGEPVELGTNAS